MNTTSFINPPIISVHDPLSPREAPTTFSFAACRVVRNAEGQVIFTESVSDPALLEKLNATVTQAMQKTREIAVELSNVQHFSFSRTSATVTHQVINATETHSCTDKLEGLSLAHLFPQIIESSIASPRSSSQDSSTQSETDIPLEPSTPSSLSQISPRLSSYENALESEFIAVPDPSPSPQHPLTQTPPTRIAQSTSPSQPSLTHTWLSLDQERYKFLCTIYGSSSTPPPRDQIISLLKNLETREIELAHAFTQTVQPEDTLKRLRFITEQQRELTRLLINTVAFQRIIESNSDSKTVDLAIQEQMKKLFENRTRFIEEKLKQLEQQKQTILSSPNLPPEVRNDTLVAVVTPAALNIRLDVMKHRTDDFEKERAQIDKLYSLKTLVTKMAKEETAAAFNFFDMFLSPERASPRTNPLLEDFTKNRTEVPLSSNINLAQKSSDEYEEAWLALDEQRVRCCKQITATTTEPEKTELLSQMQEIDKTESELLHSALPPLPQDWESLAQRKRRYTLLQTNAQIFLQFSKFEAFAQFTLFSPEAKKQLNARIEFFEQQLKLLAEQEQALSSTTTPESASTRTLKETIERKQETLTKESQHILNRFKSDYTKIPETAKKHSTKMQEATEYEQEFMRKHFALEAEHLSR